MTIAAAALSLTLAAVLILLVRMTLDRNLWRSEALAEKEQRRLAIELVERLYKEGK